MSFLIFTGCEETLTAGDSEPGEFVGVWSSPDLNSKIGSAKPTKPCEGMDVSSEGVSMDLIEIKSDGQLLSAREITNTSQLFRVDGQVSAAGKVNPGSFAMEAYFGDSIELAKQNGMSVTPNIQLRLFSNGLQGKMLEMTIEAKFSKPGLEQKQKFPTRTFMQTSQNAQKEMLGKLKKCVDN